jgi:hypothetical protein
MQENQAHIQMDDVEQRVKVIYVTVCDFRSVQPRCFSENIQVRLYLQNRAVSPLQRSQGCTLIKNTFMTAE